MMQSASSEIDDCHIEQLSKGSEPDSLNTSTDSVLAIATVNCSAVEKSNTSTDSNILTDVPLQMNASVGGNLIEPVIDEVNAVVNTSTSPKEYQKVRTPTASSGIRQMWKIMGALGDTDALSKLEAIREADRISRRKSRQLLKARGLNGDPDALAILARNRSADTAAHRKRRALLNEKAASGDPVAIEKLAKAKARYTKKAIENTLNDTDPDNLDSQAKPKRKYTKRKLTADNAISTDGTAFDINSAESLTGKVSGNFKSKGKNAKRSHRPYTETMGENDSLVDVEAEAISALGLLHETAVASAPPFESLLSNSVRIVGVAVES